MSNKILRRRAKDIMRTVSMSSSPAGHGAPPLQQSAAIVDPATLVAVNGVVGGDDDKACPNQIQVCFAVDAGHCQHGLGLPVGCGLTARSEAGGARRALWPGGGAGGQRNNT